MNTVNMIKPPPAARENVPCECFAPEVDVIETANAYSLRLDVPGATPDGLDVQFERGELTIRATQKPMPAPSRWLLREYAVGNYERRFTVGEGVDVNRIEAKLQHGVLTLTLPKSDEIRARKIAVKTA